MGYVANARLEDMIDVDAPGQATRIMADMVGDAFERNVRALTPVDSSPYRDPASPPPGRLKASIDRTRIRRFPGGWRGEVFTDDPIAPFVEWDTRPHDIRPRADRAAASVVETGRPRGTVQDGRAALSWRSSGGRHFAKVVHHPGTSGAHMFSRGAAVTQQELDAICAPALRQFERMLTSVRSRPVRVGNVR